MKLNTMATRLEIKATDDQTGTIEGLGSVFNELDDHGDIILPGAFTDTLKSGRSVKMLFQHNTSQPIGVWDEMEETKDGLRAKGRLALDTTLGRDVMAMLRMKAIDGLSIGYRVMKGGAEWDDDTGIRTISALELWELSVVTFPSMANALIDGVKSAEEIDALDLTGIERHMREACGLSRSEAKSLLHRHSALVIQREAGLREAKATEVLANSLSATIADLKSLQS